MDSLVAHAVSVTRVSSEMEVQFVLYKQQRISQQTGNTSMPYQDHAIATPEPRLAAARASSTLINGQ